MCLMDEVGLSSGSEGAKPSCASSSRCKKRRRARSSCSRRLRRWVQRRREEEKDKKRAHCRCCHYRRKYVRTCVAEKLDLTGLLRPVNLCGKRAPGMRAPRNTTQFLMHQAYQDLQRQEGPEFNYSTDDEEEGDNVLEYDRGGSDWSAFRVKSDLSLEGFSTETSSGDQGMGYFSSDGDVKNANKVLVQDFETYRGLMSAFPFETS
ncbi:uncharacterized protein WU:FB55G09 [Latimeria chalumnae]|uniref:uncharacterized protein WU:FB55G09 n=1 Tax=Latimeria chalumnae TaxID=7897 RepID=UPI0006D911F8|nr:PREDICTED: uncharacterized protein LOC106706169 [Latimeria chalumnae]|eukprot:XP_014352191.1 PREDICTED: uncharacterized protein LOC106706169 [Latimeria chalumnae]